MAIHKLDHTGEKTNTDLWWAHNHGGYDDDTNQHGNLKLLDTIDQNFLDRVRDRLLLRDFSNLSLEDKQTLTELIESLDLDFMEPGTPNVPHLRVNDDWAPLSSYETVVELTGHEGRIDVVLREQLTPQGNPLRAYSVSLSEDTTTKLDDIPNKLDKLPVSSNVNELIIADATGRVARSGILSSELVKISNLESNPAVSSEVTAASAKALNTVYTDVEKLKNGVSSCRGRVVNAYTAPEISIYCNISGVEVEANAHGRGYEVGQHVSIDATDAIIPVDLVVSEVTDVGGIVSLEIVGNGGYYHDTFNPEHNVSYNLYGGTGSGAAVRITAVREGINADTHTTLSDISDVNAGDTVYVMVDETNGSDMSLYMYQQVASDGGQISGSWVYVMSFGNNVISRYEEDTTHLEGDEVLIQRIS